MRLDAISRNDDLHRGVIQVMIDAMPILGALEFLNTPAEAIQYKQTAARSAGGEYRTKGNEYASTTDRNIAQGSSGIAYFGEVSKIDKADKQTHNNIPQLRTARINNAAKDVAEGLVNELFSGAGPGSDELTGFINLVDNAYSLAIDTNGTDIRANEAKFIEFIDQNIFDFGADLFSMNGQIYAFMVNLARRMHALNWEKNEFGTRVAYWDNVPFFPVSSTAIPNTETQGTNSDCTSLYAVKVGEMEDVTIHSTVGVDVTDYEAAPGTVTEKAMVEFYGQNIMYNQDAVLQLKGLRLPAA